VVRLPAVTALALVFASSAHAATVPVTVDDNFFDPGTAHAQPGDQVQWTWAGDASHSVTSDGGESYDSGIRNSGTYSHFFNVAGTSPITAWFIRA
jgi:plastocyanin